MERAGRDLKPGNLMLRGDATPIVLDFGLGGRMEGEAGELTRRLFGSAWYVAPEQVRAGETGSDPRSDIYQLGLLLYEFLTLRRAFPGDDVSAVLRQIDIGAFQKPRKLNRGIPVDLEATTLKAMELRPDRRYQTAREFREDLERFLSGMGRPTAVSGGVLSLFLRDGRYLLRRNKLSALIVLALTLGVALGSLFIEGGSDSSRTRPT